MKRAIIILPLILVILVSLGLGYGERPANIKSTGQLSKTAIIGDNTIFDANRVKTFVRNNGSFNRDPGTGNAGFEWPKGSGKTAIYASGLWIGAKVQSAIRVAIAEYSYEFEAGPIASGITPSDSRWKVYKIKRGDDAAKNSDYADWPFNDGAPALSNFDNTADSLDASGNKIPLLLGDMTTWCVYNDNNPAVHTNMGTGPLGIEIQMTVWGYNRSDALGDAYFIRWKVINKGGRQLDSTYISIWSDCDIGGGAHDFDGCDTILGLGYTYSGDPVNVDYGSTPPAAGFDFLQGPLIPSSGDTVYLPDGTVKPGYKKLQMTSYIRYDNDNTIDLGNPFTGDEVYNYFRSLTRSGLPIKYGPDTTRIINFMYPGDPAQAYSITNWIENSGSSDRRFMMSSGPFTMAPGDTQDIVGGCLIAQGSNNIASVTALKNADALIQKAYDLNFKLPDPPPTPVVEVAPLDKTILLSWAKDEAKADEIESYFVVDPIAAAGGAADSIYDFEGYVVYQYDNNTDRSESHTKIVQTFDLINGVTDIYDDVFDPNLGTNIRKPVERGTDKGIFRSIRITSDAFAGGKLINDKDYYFGVAAYAYGSQSVPRVLESSVSYVTVRPRQILMGSSYSSSGVDTLGSYNNTVQRTIISHVTGSGVGHAEAIVMQPDSITGDTYEIRFDAVGSGTTWKIVNTTKNITIDSLKTNQADDDAFPIKDGIKWKVVDAPVGLDASSLGGGAYITPTDTSLQWIAGDGDTWEMPYLDGGLDLGSYITLYLGYTDNTLPTKYNPYKKVQLIFGGSTQKAYRYRRYAVGGVTRYRFDNMQTVPIQAWDVSNTLNPRQLNIAWRDQVNDSIWDPGSSYLEVLVVCASTYDSTGATYGDGGPWETDAMYFLGTLIKPNHTLNESINTIWITPVPANGPSDIYRVSTANYKSTSGNVAIAKTQIERINAVPNPYFGSNAYEHNQFNRVIRITNLPAKAKIRIFNLVGELVNVLDKDDPTTTSIDWDLTNRNSLPVASGMYIIHIDLGAIGTKIIKVAVIMAEERLDNF